MLLLKLIKAIRFPECLLVAFLAFISFKISGIDPDWLTIVARFFVMAVTMLQNDWVDRIHDLGKGKRLAYEKPKIFITWLVLFWIISGGLIFILFKDHPVAAGILLGMALLGAIYSEARRVPLLSVILVTFPMIASTILLPLGFGATFYSLAPLFIATALIMFGRETLHDIADTEVDHNYKKTMPIIIGDQFTRTMASISILIGCSFAILVSPIAIIGSIFIIWGLTKVDSEPKVVKSRKRVDMGLACLALGLALI